MLFVDTGAWFAYFLPIDPDHAACEPVFFPATPRWSRPTNCVDETLTLLQARGEPRRALDAGRALFEEDIARLHMVSADQISRAWILFQQRLSNGWSFTDCTSKIVIDDLGIKTAVALDAHFRQYGIAVVP
jgi:predicted nucleic acid-binding protein